jgi:hypothetical protein
MGSARNASTSTCHPETSHGGPVDRGRALCEVSAGSRVHYLRMKNVTLSAEENLIEQARLTAKAQRRTLNAAFREWLVQFTGPREVLRSLIP